MGLVSKFWELNGNPERITVKGAFVLIAAFVGVVLAIAGISNLIGWIF